MTLTAEVQREDLDEYRWNFALLAIADVYGQHPSLKCQKGQTGQTGQRCVQQQIRHELWQFAASHAAKVSPHPAADIFSCALWRKGQLRVFEADLCSRFAVDSLQIADTILSARSWNQIRWECQVHFDPTDPFSERYAVTFAKPIVGVPACLNTYYLDGDRFLYAKLRGLVSPVPKEEDDAFMAQFWDEHWAQMKLFRDGIDFAGRRYVFLGGEVDKGSASSAASKSKSFLQCWFVAVEQPGPLRSLRTPLPVSIVRNYLGQLEELTESKCNARLKLAFSTVFPIEIADTDVRVVNDICALDSHCVLSDGCGLIGAQLARKIPYAISHGVPKGLRPADAPLPCVIQVRCVCRQGLFKGCLLVTDDSSICGSHEIRFVESMRKAMATQFEDFVVLSGDNDRPECDPFASLRNRRHKSILGVVCTFEHPDQHSQRAQREMSDFSARLNRSLCALLSALRVPRDALTSLLKGELAELCYDNNIAKQAYQLARQSIMNAVVEGADWCDRSEDDDTAEDDSDQSERYYSADTAYSQQSNPLTVKKKTLGETTLQFIFAGHSVTDEPYLRQLYWQLKLQRLKYLSRCNITVRNAIYLVGVPDPYGFLQPDEVFIFPPNDRARASDSTSFSQRAFTADKVVVTRHPMQHPGDIRCFRAVEHPLLWNHSGWKSQMSGGAIVFSTRGERAPADEMSGGDYDGDKYLILYGEPFVSSVHCVAALSAAEEAMLEAKLFRSNTHQDNSSQQHLQDRCSSHPIYTDACQQCLDPIGVKMFIGLLRSCQQQYVGFYSNAWLAFADENPFSDDALLCGHIVRVALDAAKTGKRIPLCPDLLSRAPRGRHLNVDLQDELIQAPMKKARIDDETAFLFKGQGDMYEDDMDWLLNHMDSYCKFDATSDLFSDLTSSSYSLDSSNTARLSSCCSQSILQEMFEIVRESMLTSRTETLCAENGLHLDWELLIVEGDETRNHYSLCGEPILIDDDFRNKVLSYFPNCYDELTEWHFHYNKFLSSFADLRTKSKRVFNQEENKSGGLAVVCNHRQLFDSKAKSFAVKLGVSEAVARLRLAGFVYLATYLTASRKMSEKKASLSYCWDICGIELHHNKIQMRKRKELVSPLENILPSFLSLI